MSTSKMTKNDLAAIIKDQKAEMADMKARLADREARLDDKDQKLEELRDRLDHLEAGASAQAPETKVPPWLQAVLDSQQNVLDSQRDMLESQRDMLGAQRDRIDQLTHRLDNAAQPQAQGRAHDEAGMQGAKPQPPGKLTPTMSLHIFKAWKAKWKDYANLCKVDKMTPGQQVSILRTHASMELIHALDHHVIKVEGDGVDNVLKAVEKHIRSKRNITLDLRDFDYRVQESGESFDSYQIAIRRLADNADLTEGHCNDCGPACLDRRLSARLISGISDEETRQKLLAMKTFPKLDEVIALCNAEESAKEGNKDLKGKAINAARFGKGKGKSKDKKQDLGGSKPATCGACGFKYHEKSSCPARNETCAGCGKKGHFKAVCKNKESKQQQKGSKDDKEGSKKQNRVIHINNAGLRPSATVSVQMVHAKTGEHLGSHIAMPDTGADACVAGPDLLKSAGLKKGALRPLQQGRLVGFNGSNVKCMGVLPVSLDNKVHKAKADVYICPGVKNNFLLSREVCKGLGYVPKNFPEVITVNAVSQEQEGPSKEGKAAVPLSSDRECRQPSQQELTWSVSDKPNRAELDALRKELIAAYADVFSEDEQLPAMNGEPMRIHLKEGAIPFSVNAARRVPHPSREFVKKQLEIMVREGVIEPVDKPTEWNHPMVVVPKPKGGWRICVDLTRLNKFVKRPLHPMTTPREAVEKIKPGSDILTVADFRHGYWQVPMHPDCQELTTFVTPWGRYKFLRNPMGLVSAQDEYGRRGDLALADLENVCKVVDDLLVFGSTKEGYQQHVDSVVKMLDRCRAAKITLHPKKFKLAMPEVEYVGYRISGKGIEADPAKLSAIADFPKPTNLTELRSFFGLVNQLNDFTQEIKGAAAPLRDLLKTKNAFTWLPQHDQAFDAVKATLVKPPVLAPFDPDLPTAIQTDASRLKGLGFVLMQKHDDGWKLVQCGSRFISDTESRYAMCELELLAVYWAVAKKCRNYLLGLPGFKVVTDHKPLVPILNSYTLDMIENPRLQRMKEKLACYQLEAEWKKGAEHFIPDALSRAPVDDPTKEDLLEDEVVESHVIASVKMVANAILDDDGEMLDLGLEKVRAAAAADPDYVKLKDVVAQGFPTDSKKLDPAVRPYWSVRDELALAQDLVIKGGQLVIPRSMRKDILSYLHSSHQGIDRTKRRARQAVFWPGYTSDIASTVQACEPCQLNLPSQQKETMKFDPLPSRPFVEVSADLFSTAGRQYMVTVDRHSGWPIVHSWRNMPDAERIIGAFLEIFATHGVPLRIRTDGGPQFASSTFQDFLKEWNIHPGPSTPYYPQSNGHAEAAVKAMKALVTKTECKGDLAHPDFLEGLLEWRNTPKEHGYSPAQLVYGHSLRSKVPELIAKSDDHHGPDKKKKAQKLRNKRKLYYDKNAADLSPLDQGDHVKVQDPKTKLWDKVGLVLSSGRNRDYHVVTDSGKSYWRNRRFLRPVPTPGASEGEGQRGSEGAAVAGATSAGRSRPASGGPNSSPLRRSTRVRRQPDRY